MFSTIFINKINIIFYIIYTISSFYYNIITFLIIDKFSPTHTAIAFISENLAIFIIESITDGRYGNIDYKFGLRLVMYILLLFAAFIYNEFFVINICGLANGTKLFLDYKEQADLSLINDENKINKNLFEDNNEENIRTSSLSSVKTVELSEL